MTGRACNSQVLQPSRPGAASFFRVWITPCGGVYRRELCFLGLMANVWPHGFQHLEGMLTEGVSSIYSVPLLIQSFHRLVRLKENVAIRILDKVGGFILQSITRVMENMMTVLGS